MSMVSRSPGGSTLIAWKRRSSERSFSMYLRYSADVAVDDLLRQSFDDGRLADARLADEHRIVLGPAAEHLLHPLELVLAADERIELILHRRLGKVAAELGQERRLFHPRQRRL